MRFWDKEGKGYALNVIHLCAKLASGALMEANLGCELETSGKEGFQ